MGTGGTAAACPVPDWWWLAFGGMIIDGKSMLIGGGAADCIGHCTAAAAAFHPGHDAVVTKQRACWRVEGAAGQLPAIFPCVRLRPFFL